MNRTVETSTSAGAAAAPEPGFGVRRRARVVRLLRTGNGRAAPLAAAVLAAVLLALLEPGFYRPANLHVLMQQYAVLGLVTLGQLLVLLVSGIDLSVGAVMNASLIVIALMNQHNQRLLVVSLALCLLLGAVVGLVNGLLVSVRNVPPFAATLGMTACVQGAILVYTKGIPAGNIPTSLRPIALAGVGVIPYSLIICLAIGGAAFFVLAKGTPGRRIYAVGRSPEAARRVGISITAVRIGAYVVCGTLAALAGIILSAYVGYVDPAIGGNYNLESIAAAVLGGVSFVGGQGSVPGALIGALFLLTVLNVTTLSSLNPYIQLMVQGIVMLAAVSLVQLFRTGSST